MYIPSSNRGNEICNGTNIFPLFPSCIILMNQPRLRNSLGYETETRRAAATTKTLVHHLGSKCGNYAVSQHTLTKMARISWIILPSSIPKYQENWLLLQKPKWGNFLPFNFPGFSLADTVYKVSRFCQDKQRYCLKVWQ